MNQQDQQAIDDLFRHLYRTAAQGEPRDRQAEAMVQQHIQQGPPGLLYHMAQTLVGQQAALRQLRAQLADCQQQLRQGGSPAGFAQPGRRSAGQQGYGDYAPPYQPSGWQRSGGQGFLAGAGQIALGVGGGILAAEALGNLFSGGGLFGGDDYGEREYDQGYYDGRQDEERQDDDRQDDGGQYDGDGGYDGAGGYDGGGGFDGGGWLTAVAGNTRPVRAIEDDGIRHVRDWSSSASLTVEVAAVAGRRVPAGRRAGDRWCCRGDILAGPCSCPDATSPHL